MVEHSQLLLANLVEQSEVAIGPEADECAHFVADIFNCVVLGDLNFDRFALNESQDLYLNLFRVVFELLDFIVAVTVVEKISSKLNFSSAKDSKHFFFFTFCEIGAFESTYSHTLTHTESFEVFSLGHFIEILRQVEVS